MRSKDQIAVLKDEPVGKALIQLAVPAILTNLVMTLYNVVDTAFISQLHNNSMIAATTVALPLMVIIQAVGDGIGAGTGSYIGRMLGEGNEKKVQKIISTAMTMTLIASVILIVFTMTGLKGVVGYYSPDAEVAQYAFVYMQVLMGLSFFSIIKLVLSFLLRSAGDVRYQMFATITGVVLNVLLDPFFMFDWGLGLEIQGAALATMVAEVVSVVMMLMRIIKRKSVIQWIDRQLIMDKESVSEIFNVGFAVALRSGLPSISYGLLAKSAGLFGTDFVAASGLARKAQTIAVFVVMGIASSYQPFASYNFGAKNKNRLMKAIKYSIGFTLIYGIIMGIVLYFFPIQLMSMFTSDKMLCEMGKGVLQGLAFSIPILGVYQILATSFQAMGKGKLALLNTILHQSVIYWPMVYFLPRWFGKFGFYAVKPITDWMTLLMIVTISRPLINEIQELSEEN